jgi:Excalibur calcium-binding domain
MDSGHNGQDDSIRGSRFGDIASSMTGATYRIVKVDALKARLSLASLLALIVLLNCGLFDRSLAQEVNEDLVRLCPLISPELAKEIAAELKGQGKCDTYCSGCGCKGGPGYRDRDDHCVGWKDIIQKCGPPPHDRCARECEPVSAGCPGRAWVKGVAQKLKLPLTFLPGTEHKPKAKKQNGMDELQKPVPSDRNAVPKTETKVGGEFTCSGKRRCGEMLSCDEAKFYLKTCGVKSLDGDQDGVPCNSLCRNR